MTIHCPILHYSYCNVWPRPDVGHGSSDKYKMTYAPTGKYKVCDGDQKCDGDLHCLFWYDGIWECRFTTVYVGLCDTRR